MSEREEFSTYFRTIQIKFSRFYAHVLTKTNLTFQQYALLNQLVSAGTISMTDAGEKLMITKPAVTHLVDRLEKGAYIKRISQPGDRRVYLLEIQPKGKKIVREIQSLVLNFLLKALHKFEPGERQTIVRFYSVLSKSMDEILMQAKKGKK